MITIHTMHCKDKTILDTDIMSFWINDPDNNMYESRVYTVKEMVKYMLYITNIKLNLEREIKRKQKKIDKLTQALVDNIKL